jgi:diguanylate cyclase (GGDEF)-like protein/putative nucleotidyltransferase with HDIG domain
MDTPEPTIIIAAGIIVWTLFLLVAMLAIVKAMRASRAMEKRTLELARRAEQLRLLNRISFLLSGETQRRGVARVGTEFLVQEMGAGRAVFWRPDSEGEPEAPWLSFPLDGQSAASPLLPEAQRIVLARTAGRGDAPVIVHRDSQDQRPQPLSVTGAPAGGFVLYVPLRGGSPREGVLELYSGVNAWGPDHWELLAPVAAQLGGALQRTRHYEEMRQRADLDFVTGLFNHRFMQVYLQRLVTAEATRGRSFGLLLMDVDNFKTINDTYGHSVGDRVLQAIADQLKLMTDRVGTVGRFGGDEFIVVLPNHSREEACIFAQAFQDWLASYTLGTPGGQRISIVISCGLAVFPEDGERRQELLAVADARLYERKHPEPNSAGHRRNHHDRPSLGAFGFLEGLVTWVDNRDHYTRAHCETTAEYAVMLAQEIGLSPSAQRTVRLAALLHDVGKICIPDDILRKRGELTPEEFAVIKHHVSIAEHLIVDVPDAEEVRDIARHHHEHFDGSGYPDGLWGEEIPYLARIMAVGDAFSAMTLDRPHRAGLSREEACAELQRVAGSQLDPDLVQAFGRALRAQEEDLAAPVSLIQS